MNYFIQIGLALLFFAAISHAQAGDQIISSPETQVSLIELYSSEGCNSCPPADVWLSSLRRHPYLWKSFVPIEFHVDYWNRLGWIDRFSRQKYTTRQQQYSAEWGSLNVYTPEFTLNGHEWRPPVSDFSLFSSPPKRVGVLSTQYLGQNRFRVKFEPIGHFSSLWIHGALLGNGLISKVYAGENSGRTLRHDFVALSFVSHSLSKQIDSYTGIVDLGQTPQLPYESLSFAIWVSAESSQQPIQAVGGGLP